MNDSNNSTVNDETIQNRRVRRYKDSRPTTTMTIMLVMMIGIRLPQCCDAGDWIDVDIAEWAKRNLKELVCTMVENKSNELNPNRFKQETLRNTIATTSNGTWSGRSTVAPQKTE